ncbi:MAG TPA: helix-turn-helix domain-containing protein [Planctomycetota bacterium]|nr:helix-turn-helix domain-containing protein [Planctomycetota bacterium]
MDAFAIAARALAKGDPLAALSALAGREGPHADALTGIALAQLDELGPAREGLECAARAFARRRDRLSQARALAAAAEVAAAQRDLSSASGMLERATRALLRERDRRNAAWTLAIHARLRALHGDLGAARDLVARARRALPADADATVRAGIDLARADLATRALDASAAIAALDRVARGVEDAAPAIRSETDALAARLRAEVAVAVCGRERRSLDAPSLSRLLRGEDAPRRLVVDAFGKRVQWGGRAVDLSRSPVLFALLRALAERWPSAADWHVLADSVFGFATPDDSIRLRCKVEIDRLRRRLPATARIAAERNAWRLVLPRASEPAIVAPRSGVADFGRLVLALLGDGSAWSIEAIGSVTRRSRATVLRTLRRLVAEGRVHALGAARARRYVAAAPLGIASQMLLVGLLAPERS